MENDSRTLWVGDLDPSVDENGLYAMFQSVQSLVTNVKLIRDKGTQLPSGYGFVEFKSHSDADKVRSLLDGQPVPGLPKRYRLNWAQFGVSAKYASAIPGAMGGMSAMGGAMGMPMGMAGIPASAGAGPLFAIFIGDLAHEVTDAMLEQTFRERYASVASARCVTDVGGRPRGYGFVRFRDEEESRRAIEEMNGQFLLTRQMRIHTASTQRKADSGQSAVIPPPPSLLDSDPSNTTVFIGNLDNSVSPDQLRVTFEPFGEISAVKIPPGKGCGFVHYLHRLSAENAIQAMHGQFVGANRVRLSWGRASNPTTAARPMIDFSSGSSTTAIAAAYGITGSGGHNAYTSVTGAAGGATGGGMGMTGIPYGTVGSADYNAWASAQQQQQQVGGMSSMIGNGQQSYGGPYDPNSQAAYGFSGFPGASPSAAATAAVVTADLGSLLSSVSTALGGGGNKDEKTNGNSTMSAPGDIDGGIMDEDDDDIPLYTGDLARASRLAADIARANSDYSSRHTHILLTSSSSIGGGSSFGIHTIRDIIA